VTFLPTADLTQTRYFYEKLSGLPLVLDQGVCHIYQVISSAFVGFCTECSAVGDRVNADGAIVTFVTSQVDVWYEYFREKGVTIEKKPTLNKKFNIYHLFVCDPDGYLVEFQTFLDPKWLQIETM